MKKLHLVAPVIVHLVVFTTMSLGFAWLADYIAKLKDMLLVWQFWYLPFCVAIGAITEYWSSSVVRLSKKIFGEDERPLSEHKQTIEEIVKRPRLIPLLAVPAFGEELMYRGLLQPMIIHILAFWEIGEPVVLGIIIPAVIFGFMHRDQAGQRWTRWHLASMIDAGTGSVLFGWAAWMTGSLWPAILAHAAHNIIAGLHHHLHYKRRLSVPPMRAERRKMKKRARKNR